MLGHNGELFEERWQTQSIKRLHHIHHHPSQSSEYLLVPHNMTFTSPSTKIHSTILYLLHFLIFFFKFKAKFAKERSCCAATKFLVSRRNYISASSISISSENGKFKSRLPEDFGDVTVRDLRYVPALSDISDISQISINPPHPHLATKLHSASTEMVKLKSSQMRNE